jgi:hypothetical protein
MPCRSPLVSSVSAECDRPASGSTPPDAWWPAGFAANTAQSRGVCPLDGRRSPRPAASQRMRSWRRRGAGSTACGTNPRPHRDRMRVWLERLDLHLAYRDGVPTFPTGSPCPAACVGAGARGVSVLLGSGRFMSLTR